MSKIILRPYNVKVSPLRPSLIASIHMSKDIPLLHKYSEALSSKWAWLLIKKVFNHLCKNPMSCFICKECIAYRLSFSKTRNDRGFI